MKICSYCGEAYRSPGEVIATAMGTVHAFGCFPKIVHNEMLAQADVMKRFADEMERIRDKARAMAFTDEQAFNAR